MTWDEIRAAYPDRELFIEAKPVSFDGDMIQYTPLSVLGVVPTDGTLAKHVHRDLLRQHAVVVKIHTLAPRLEQIGSFCGFHYCLDAPDLEEPAMRIVVRDAPRSRGVDPSSDRRHRRGTHDPEPR